MVDSESITGMLMASGRADRFGGIPKFLLPVNKNGDCLIDLHVSTMLEVCDSVIISTQKHFVDLLALRFKSMDVSSKKLRIIPKKPSTMPDAAKFLASIAQTDKLLIGMPDTYTFHDGSLNPYGRMLSSLSQSNEGNRIVTSIAGVWHMRPEQAGKLGQLKIDKKTNEIKDVVDKDPYCNYDKVWGTLLLSKSFMDFIEADDFHLGMAMNRAITSGEIIGISENPGEYHDIGDLEQYRRLINKLLD